MSQLEHSTRYSVSDGGTCPKKETPPNFTARKTSPEQFTVYPPEHTGTGRRMKRNRWTTLEKPRARYSCLNKASIENKPTIRHRFTWKKTLDTFRDKEKLEDVTALTEGRKKQSHVEIRNQSKR